MKKAVGGLLVAVGVLLSITGSAAAGESRKEGSGQSCVVYAPKQYECFSNNAEANAAADAHSGNRTPQEYQGGAFDCAWGWLCLYGSTGGNGRRLIFSDEHWHRLDDYGFGGKVKSWRNNQLCPDDGMLGDGVGGVLVLEGCGRTAAMDPYWSNAAIHVHG
ncbi:peptidase inhibitor family I36 protein [Pseudonocardia sp. ICBG1142]|uniref:peptidase inhibitor family I36 protein n=2 Tax=Pseudonocardia sp. ICBG1142 TaxID=2846760 RepID=UPI001CF6CCB4